MRAASPVAATLPMTPFFMFCLIFKCWSVLVHSSSSSSSLKHTDAFSQFKDSQVSKKISDGFIQNQRDEECMAGVNEFPQPCCQVQQVFVVSLLIFNHVDELVLLLDVQLYEVINEVILVFNDGLKKCQPLNKHLQIKPLKENPNHSFCSRGK